MYAKLLYQSMASPYNAQEFVHNFQSRLKISEKALHHLSEYFITYTSHPISHYSFKTFAAGISPKKMLIIHDHKDDSTPYKNAIKTIKDMRDNNLNVELKSTDGLFHNLRSKEVVIMVDNFLDGE